MRRIYSPRKLHRARKKRSLLPETNDSLLGRKHQIPRKKSFDNTRVPGHLVETGRCLTEEVDFEATGSLIAERPRNLPPAQEAEILRQAREEDGTFKPAPHAKWVSPAFCVTKKTETWRQSRFLKIERKRMLSSWDLARILELKINAKSSTILWVSRTGQRNLIQHNTSFWPDCKS
eukprot:GHVP01068772.1.p1 GENE.GHVP01068772.1~~GHVP01068772.1.p1  ORF type:complete len:176 (+),score=18.25 GHVP01068772.1:343-870(+)